MRVFTELRFLVEVFGLDKPPLSAKGSISAIIVKMKITQKDVNTALKLKDVVNVNFDMRDRAE